MNKSVFRRVISHLLSMRWDLGIIDSGLDKVLTGSDYKVKWIKNPYRDRWFADPFILEINEKHMTILAEEYRYKSPVGRIAKLSVNIRSFQIENYKIILDLPTHLSFPFIYRSNGNIYVCPENCQSGKLNMYRYDDLSESLVYERTICEDVVWDSAVTDIMGKNQLWTAHSDDFHLDIYDWDENSSRFHLSESICSSQKDCRLAGSPFVFQNRKYYPAQDCSIVYGGAVIIKEVIQSDQGLVFKPVKTIRSTHPVLKEGFHTFNVYKDIIAVDAHGYNYPYIGKTYSSIRKWIK